MIIKKPLHSFSMKNIFYDKMYLRLFYFHGTSSTFSYLFLSSNLHYSKEEA